MNIYVGCALKHAPDDYKQSIRIFKDRLKQEPHVTILEFISVLNSDPALIYHNDIVDCVGKCDIMIADFTLPSLGLGYEVGTMIEHHKKPVIGIAQEGSVVSGLILGIPSDKFSFTYYKDLDEMVMIVKEKIAMY